MITSKNNAYRDPYAALFQEAFDVLEAAGEYLTNEEKAVGTFTSLEEYFMHIGDLASIHGSHVRNTLNGSNQADWNANFSRYSKFLMLPLDEEYFKINANTRTISIPSVFASSGVGLEGDTRAETLLFEIDRYFDFIDLLRTNIYVQWSNPAGTSGATLISLIDYDDQKIRFGWTLSDKIAVPGGKPLSFSIRFIMRDGENIIYSLNTSPISVKIRTALRYEIERTYTDEAPYLFVEAIKNGANSHTSEYPEFAHIFKDLDAGNVYLDNDAYTFTLKATPIDTGVLSYVWRFTPYDPNGNDDETPQAIVLPGEKEDVTVEICYEKISKSEEKQPNKRYYTRQDGGAFIIFAGDAFDDNTDYYEQVAKCQISPSEDGEVVAGDYQVEIINTLHGNVCSKYSAKSTIPAPTTITYTKDLVENGAQNILVTAIETTDTTPQDGKVYYTKTTENSKNVYVQFAGESFDEKVTYYELKQEKELSINAVPDDNHATLSYQWYKQTTSTETASKIQGATSSSYVATVPGWYRVKTTSTLNRVSIDENSIVSKVTQPPERPTFVSGSPDTAERVNCSPIPGSSSIYQILIVGQVPNPQSLDPLLVSDGLTYTWHYSVANSADEQNVELQFEYDKSKQAWIPTNAGNSGIKSYIIQSNGQLLTIEYKNDITVWCTITNTLNGDTVSVTSTDYVIMK